MFEFQPQPITQVTCSMQEQVVYLFSNPLYTEQTTRDRAGRSIEELCQHAPEGAFCFYLAQRIQAQVVVGEQSFSLLCEQPVATSPKVFLGGTRYTVAQVRERFPAKDSLVRNLTQDAPGQQLVQTKLDSWHRLTANDLIYQESIRPSSHNEGNLLC